MSDQLSDFIDHMRSAGVGPHDPAEIIPDDVKRRYRLEGDKAKTKNGSYALRIEPDGFAFGWALSFREGHTHKWHTKSTKKLTDDERAAFKAKAAAAKKARDAKSAEESASAAKKAERIWNERCQTEGTTEYLTRKQVPLNGARVMGDMVVVPLKAGGKLVGLQFIKPDGSKVFNKNVAKEGSYFSIAKKGDDLGQIIICEGFATGGSLRAATGCPVIVAFDAGNLKPVAAIIRKKYPDAAITIAADNDQWTTKPDGSAWNPGIEKAQQAAVAIGGARVVYPNVPADDPSRRTDWNDIAVTDGIEVIKAALAPPQPTDEGYDFDRGAPDHDDIGHFEVPDIGADTALEGIHPLGYNDQFYYFLPKTTGQVVEVSASALGSLQTLQRLVPKSWLVRWFGGENGSDKEITSNASSALMEVCHRTGIYNPDRIRGIGAWMEGSDCVFNTGTRIISNGQDIPISQYKSGSAFLYPLANDRVGQLPEAMSDADAFAIVKLCTALKWSAPMSGYYLAGWIVTAILGGVMRWRPHIYLTGDRGAGKSTVLDELVKRLLGGLVVEADGGSTEAGIRREIFNASIPVIMDESEGNNRNDREKIASVMNLMRASSSGGVVLNALEKYKCRASFLMAGINPQIRTEADKSRMAVIHLRADDAPGAEERYKAWRDSLDHVTRHGASGRLVARLIECSAHMPATLAYMGSAMRNIGASARFADQHAALLSGVWLLVKRRPPSAEEASDFLEKVGMTVQREFDQDDTGGESIKVLSEIMTSDHSYDSNGAPRRATIAAMVQMARDTDGVGQRDSIAGLSDLGIEVDGDMLRIAVTSPKLSKILRDTPWASDGWARHLMGIHGAREGKRRAFRGLSRRRTIEVPLKTALGENDPAEVELPFGDMPDWDEAPVYSEDDFK